MIEVRGLTKSFRLSRKQRKEVGSRHEGSVAHAVQDVSFACSPGRIFTLLGPNGAGKTTTLRMIATLMRPTSGAVSVCGFDSLQQPREVRRRIGFLTGSTRLYERLTPRELVRFYAGMYGMERAAVERRIGALFDLLDMEDFADKRIGKLSTGMTQKVSIARTMVHDPQVVVFDEPTVGLDVVTARSIIDLIRRCREEGKTIIFSTHIMGEVNLLSDDLAIIHNGRLCYNDTYEAFRAASVSPSLEEEFIRRLEEVRA